MSEAPLCSTENVLEGLCACTQNLGKFKTKKPRTPFTICSNLFFYLFICGFFVSQVIFYFNSWSSSGSLKDVEQVRSCTEQILTDDLIDFASAKAGGQIIREKSSEFSSKNPIFAVISDNNLPGNCWGFRGDTGSVLINLITEISPSSFEIFHINSLDYSSAPKSFSVFGGKDEKTLKFLLSGELDLRIKEETRNTWFKFPYNGKERVKVVSLNITSNHGGENTCVYQFKVHGFPLATS
jgi:hypothetical protein